MRIARQTDPQRIAELKVKIHNEKYLLTAIGKIAILLSNRMLQD